MRKAVVSFILSLVLLSLCAAGCAELDPSALEIIQSQYPDESSTPLPDMSPGDPLATLLPGFRWGMTVDEILERYPYVYDDGDVLLYDARYDGHRFLIWFDLDKNRNLDLLFCNTFADTESKFYDLYSSLYGEPELSQYMRRQNSGRIDPEMGPVYYWKAGWTDIRMHGSTINYEAQELVPPVVDQYMNLMP